MLLPALSKAREKAFDQLCQQPEADDDGDHVLPSRLCDTVIVNVLGSSDWVGVVRY